MEILQQTNKESDVELSRGAWIYERHTTHNEGRRRVKFKHQVTIRNYLHADKSREEQNLGAGSEWKLSFVPCRLILWNLLHVTHLAPRILRWLIDILKICALHH